jgi:hypothetical protein
MLEQCAALCLHLPVIPEEACVLAVSSFASASAVWEGKGRLFASSGVVASGQHRAHAIIATRCDARGSFCPHPACALLASESMPAPRIGKSFSATERRACHGLLLLARCLNFAATGFPANTGTASERGGLGDGVRTHTSGEVKQRTTCRHQCTRSQDTKERCVTVSARSPAPSSCAAINKQPGSAAPPGGLQRPNAISSSSSQRSVQVLVSSRHLLLFFSEIGPSPGLVSPSPSQALRDLAASVGSPGRRGTGRWSRAGTDSVIQASCE